MMSCKPPDRLSHLVSNTVCHIDGGLHEYILLSETFRPTVNSKQHGLPLCRPSGHQGHFTATTDLLHSHCFHLSTLRCPALHRLSGPVSALISGLSRMWFFRHLGDSLPMYSTTLVTVSMWRSQAGILLTETAELPKTELLDTKIPKCLRNANGCTAWNLFAQCIPPV